MANELSAKEINSIEYFAAVSTLDEVDEAKVDESGKGVAAFLLLNRFGVDKQNEIEKRFGKKVSFNNINTTTAVKLHRYLLGNGQSKISTPYKTHNRIIFGAPGTGKSYNLNQEAQSSFKDIERVTFYPSYSYGQFVGTYKPIKDDKDITYEYVPGPFMRAYVRALNNPSENVLLLIEEINRAEVASVFGDIFQLLDRKNGESEYPIKASEDINKHLVKELAPTIEGYNQKLVELSLPKNLYIWATMNSADQGVFPMDTAFKRRWNFEYLGIDEGEGNVNHIQIGEYNWNSLRKAINKVLSDKYRVNEDKLMGPFFISDSNDNVELFNNKVIMYLFEDVLRQKRSDFFNGKTRYSEVCDNFRENGLEAFDKEVRDNYNAMESENK